MTPAVPPPTNSRIPPGEGARMGRTSLSSDRRLAGLARRIAKTVSSRTEARLRPSVPIRDLGRALR